MQTNSIKKMIKKNNENNRDQIWQIKKIKKGWNWKRIQIPWII
jgi:hypothetical protein